MAAFPPRPKTWTFIQVMAALVFVFSCPVQGQDGLNQGWQKPPLLTSREQDILKHLAGVENCPRYNLMLKRLDACALSKCWYLKDSHDRLSSRDTSVRDAVAYDQKNVQVCPKGLQFIIEKIQVPFGHDHGDKKELRLRKGFLLPFVQEFARPGNKQQAAERELQHPDSSVWRRSWLKWIRKSRPDEQRYMLTELTKSFPGLFDATWLRGNDKKEFREAMKRNSIPVPPGNSPSQGAAASSQNEVLSRQDPATGHSTLSAARSSASGSRRCAAGGSTRPATRLSASGSPRHAAGDSTRPAARSSASGSQRCAAGDSTRPATRSSASDSPRHAAGDSTRPADRSVASTDRCTETHRPRVSSSSSSRRYSSTGQGSSQDDRGVLGDATRRREYPDPLLGYSNGASDTSPYAGNSYRSIVTNYNQGLRTFGLFKK